MLYSKRSRTAVKKNKTQHHLLTTQADRRAPVKLDAATLTTEYLAYSSQQFNNRTQIAQTESKGCQQFENHPNNGLFLQDLNQTEKINEFSEKSKDLIAEINTEIFQLCETSSKKQCAECNLITGRSALSIVLVEDV